MKSNLLKGIILVSIGSACYGALSVIVKMGTIAGYTTAEVTYSQFIVGFIILLAMYLFSLATNKSPETNKPRKKEIVQLIFGGVPLALTSTFLYSSFKYIDVSIAVVLLMQSIWMGSIFDYFINKVKPTTSKIIAIVVVLFGTMLATNIFEANFNIDWRGVVLGLLAALSFTVTMFASNNIAPKYTPVTRGFYMAIGALVAATCIWGHQLSQQFNLSVLWEWGIIISLSGLVLPPILFNKGFPMIGLSLGTILGAIQMPISVSMAYFLLGEKTTILQWVGIIIILIAVVLMNRTFSKQKE